MPGRAGLRRGQAAAVWFGTTRLPTAAARSERGEQEGPGPARLVPIAALGRLRVGSPSGSRASVRDSVRRPAIRLPACERRGRRAQGARGAAASRSVCLSALALFPTHVRGDRHRHALKPPVPPPPRLYTRSGVLHRLYADADRRTVSTTPTMERRSFGAGSYHEGPSRTTDLSEARACSAPIWYPSWLHRLPFKMLCSLNRGIDKP